MQEHKKHSMAQYIGQLNRSFKRHCDVHLEPYGLTNGLYLYLLYVKYQPGCSLVRLRDFFGNDKAYVTRVVSKLCKLGYLSKEQRKEDARSCCLDLTEKGREILGVIRDVPGAWDQKLGNFLDPGEEEELLRLLGKACRGMGEEECPKWDGERLKQGGECSSRGREGLKRGRAEAGRENREF